MKKMIHPNKKNVNFETMEHTERPRTTREAIIRLDGRVERLTEIMEAIMKRMENFEEKKLVGLEERLKFVESWKSEWNGSWKLIIVFGTSASIILSIVILFSKL